MADMIDHMTSRFLQWKLPDDFDPDGGITFTAVGPHGPVGTNLLTYTQAKAMVEYMIDGAPIAALPAQGVRVKPLLFSEFSEGGCMGRPHPFQYFITQAHNGRFLCHHDETWHDTLAEAQAHTQADYQRAALAPAEQPVATSEAGGVEACQCGSDVTDMDGHIVHDDDCPESWQAQATIRKSQTVDPAPVDALVKAEFAEARRTYSGFGHCQEALRYAESMVIAALAPAEAGGVEAHDEQLGVWADELMADLVLNDLMDLADHEYDTKVGARRMMIDALKTANQAKVPQPDDDPACTDCGGTGVTYQTERRCACQPAPDAVKVDKEPCGECYLPDGETCDICGAIGPSQKATIRKSQTVVPDAVEALVKAEFAEARRTYSGFGHCQEALRYAESMVLAALAAYRGGAK